MKAGNMTKSDGLLDAVLNYSKEGLPAIKSKGLRQKERTLAQKNCQLSGKVAGSEDSPTSVKRLFDLLEQKYSKEGLSMKDRTLGLGTHGIFKEGVREISAKTVRVITQGPKRI